MDAYHPRLASVATFDGSLARSLLQTAPYRISSMSCGCTCHADDEAPKDEAEVQLLDLEIAPPVHTTTPLPEAEGEMSTVEAITVAFTKFCMLTDGEITTMDRLTTRIVKCVIQVHTLQIDRSRVHHNLNCTICPVN